VVRATGVASSDVFQTLETAVATKNGEAVKESLDQLMAQGATKLWSSTANLSRRTCFMTELTRLGIKNAEELAIPRYVNISRSIVSQLLQELLRRLMLINFHKWASIYNRGCHTGPALLLPILNLQRMRT
jgi:hypothetical protein